MTDISNHANDHLEMILASPLISDYCQQRSLSLPYQLHYNYVKMTIALGSSII